MFNFCKLLRVIIGILKSKAMMSSLITFAQRNVGIERLHDYGTV